MVYRLRERVRVRERANLDEAVMENEAESGGGNDIVFLGEGVEGVGDGGDSIRAGGSIEGRTELLLLLAMDSKDQRSSEYDQQQNTEA